MSVWLLEDDDDAVILLKPQIERSAINHKVISFAYPEAALLYFEAGGLMPVVILLDLTFPGHMSGQDFMRRRPLELRSVPVVVTSGSQQHVDEMYRLGARAYLEKPILAAHLVRTFERLGIEKG